MTTRAEPNLTYAGYLHLDAILNAQHPVAPENEGPSVRAAEHFFIVTHQAFELWFKQLLLDLADAAKLLPPPASDVEQALDHLQRARSILRLLVQQMVLFDHLSPRSFLAFRPYLGTALPAAVICGRRRARGGRPPRRRRSLFGMRGRAGEVGVRHGSGRGACEWRSGPGGGGWWGGAERVWPSPYLVGPVHRLVDG